MLKESKYSVTAGSVCVTYLVPGDGAVYRVCVLKVVRFFHLVDFVFHGKSLLHEGLVSDHNLQILHHLTGCIYVDVLIVIPGQMTLDINNRGSALLLDACMYPHYFDEGGENSPKPFYSECNNSDFRLFSIIEQLQYTLNVHFFANAVFLRLFVTTVSQQRKYLYDTYMVVVFLFSTMERYHKLQADNISGYSRY